MAKSFRELFNEQQLERNFSEEGRAEQRALVVEAVHTNRLRAAMARPFRSNATSVKGVRAKGAKVTTHSPVYVSKFVDGVCVSTSIVPVKV